VSVHLGDCRPWLAAMPEASIDAIATDPPYGLAFMGREWDKALPDPATWAELLRVAKPGAHLVAFGHPRLYHRLAVDIEDAGWELRDCLMWLFGTGFPKSLDVSKAIDAAAGAERPVVGRGESGRTSVLGGLAGRSGERGRGGGELVTPDAARWSGWGTALKPAWEPIVLARKPLAGTVAANVLEHGTGGINVDGCRVGWRDESDRVAGRPASFSRAHAGFNGEAFAIADRSHRDPVAEQSNAGRWPANVVLDEEAAARLDGETGALTSRGNIGPSIAKGPPGAAYAIGAERPSGSEYTYGDSGGASRFFYTAKASRAEREAGLGGKRRRSSAEITGRAEGSAGSKHPRASVTGSKRANTHPTVKPIDLMQWLVRLVTPPGGKVLDPFTGSGTTGCAAALEGFEFAGAELSATYAEIARARIEHWRSVAVERSRQLPLFDPPEPRPRAEQTGLDFAAEAAE